MDRQSELQSSFATKYDIYTDMRSGSVHIAMDS